MLSFRRLPIAAKFHDLGVMCLAAYFALEQNWPPAIALAGWWVLVWLVRISLHTALGDWLFGWLDIELPDATVPFLAGAGVTILVEAVVLWFTWKDIVHWIVRHY